MLEDYKLAYDHICKADRWDDTLWHLYAEKDADHTFCGDAKRLKRNI